MKLILALGMSILVTAAASAQTSLKLSDLKATPIGDELMLDTRSSGIAFKRGERFTLYDYDGVAQNVEVSEVMSSGKIIVKPVPIELSSDPATE